MDWKFLLPSGGRFEDQKHAGLADSRLATSREKCNECAVQGFSGSPTGSQQVRGQSTSCTISVHLRSRNSHVMAKLGYLYWVAMLYHRCHTSRHAIIALISASPLVQFKESRPMSRVSYFILHLLPNTTSSYCTLSRWSKSVAWTAALLLEIAWETP
jgi:hypothetical protein